jgi:hypothetical protein
MALGSPKKIVGCLVNSFSEIPPLAMLPHQNRNQYLEPDGTYSNKIWDYAFEGRRIVVEGPSVANVAESGGTVWTTPESWVDGWSVAKHAHAVDGTETGFKILYGGAHYATVRPYHGFFSILWPPPAGGALFYCVSADLRHVRGFLNGGTVWIGRSDNGITSFDDFDTGIGAVWAVGAFDRRSRTQRLFLWSQSAGGGVERRYSDDTGSTFSMATTIGTGTKPFGCIPDGMGLEFVYWRDASGNVKGLVLDRAGSTVEAEFDTGVDCDDEGGDVDVSYLPSGTLRFAMWVVTAGSITKYSSTDGKTYS